MEILTLLLAQTSAFHGWQGYLNERAPWRMIVWLMKTGRVLEAACKELAERWGDVPSRRELLDDKIRRQLSDSELQQELALSLKLNA
jgi:hypothetical protein